MKENKVDDLEGWSFVQNLLLVLHLKQFILTLGVLKESNGHQQENCSRNSSCIISNDTGTFSKVHV